MRGCLLPSVLWGFHLASHHLVESLAVAAVAAVAVVVAAAAGGLEVVVEVVEVAAAAVGEFEAEVEAVAGSAAVLVGLCLANQQSTCRPQMRR